MIKIITLAFDGQTDGFNDEIVQSFLAGKQIKTIKPYFFQQHGQAYWSIWIDYEPVISRSEQPKFEQPLSSMQQQLLVALQQWRKEKAGQEKVPVYVIATNKELGQIIQQQPETLEALRLIPGFGHKKTQNHGKDIIKIIRNFQQAEQNDKG